MRGPKALTRRSAHAAKPPPRISLTDYEIFAAAKLAICMRGGFGL